MTMTESLPASPTPPRASAPAGRLLSHHAIMKLIGPFSRRGYSVDLAASDRANGVLVFRPVEIPGTEGGRPALRSTLRLERPHRAKIRVSRTLVAVDGQQATMTAEGDDADVLLEVVEQVDPDRQFHVTDAGLLTRSYRAQVWMADAPDQGRWRGDTRLARLSAAEARLGPLRLQAKEEDGYACEVRLVGQQGTALDLPTDFLAVLGWGWRPLAQLERRTWLTRISLATRGRGRTAALETQLDRATKHIFETLTASPQQYHQRHRRARWRAAFQRLIPLLYIIGVAGGLALAVMYLPRVPGLHILLNNISLVAIVVFFMRDKAYRVEIPPPPRPLSQTKWDSAATGELSETRR